MKPIESTHEFIAWKFLNKNIDESWAKWALEMISSGFETKHLIELALIEKPFNQFELNELTNLVFQELKLNYNDVTIVKNNYITYLANEALNGNRDLIDILREIKNLCISLDYDKDIYHFYSLYFAKEDLNYGSTQWYWDGADKSNIDQICLSHLKKWSIEHDYV